MYEGPLPFTASINSGQMCIPFFQAKILVPFNGVLNRADSNQGYFRAKCGYSERDIHRLHNMQALSSPRKKQGRFRPVVSHNILCSWHHLMRYQEVI